LRVHIFCFGFSTFETFLENLKWRNLTYIRVSTYFKSVNFLNAIYMMLMNAQTTLIKVWQNRDVTTLPPYKNLVLEIPKVGKEKVTRTTLVFNELVDTTMVFFVEEVDPRHHEEVGPHHHEELFILPSSLQR
jgi:hypothetical protein